VCCASLRCAVRVCALLCVRCVSVLRVCLDPQTVMGIERIHGFLGGRETTRDGGVCEVVDDGWMYPVLLAVSEEFPVSARGKWGSRTVGGMELDAAGDYLGCFTKPARTPC
jgi:hypothetical protein